MCSSDLHGCFSQMANAGVSLIESAGTSNNTILDNTFFQGATIIGANSVVRGNQGYNPAVSYPTVGASPYTFPALPYDAEYMVGLANGISALTIKGVGITTGSGIPHFVRAGTQPVVTWSGTAPTFAVIPMQG